MKVLVFAPHNDDEVLGVGGTIYKYAKAGHSVTVCEVTSGPKYKMMEEEARKAHKILGVEHTIFLNLPVVKLKSIDTTEINSLITNLLFSKAFNKNLATKINKIRAT